MKRRLRSGRGVSGRPDRTRWVLLVIGAALVAAGVIYLTIAGQVLAPGSNGRNGAAASGSSDWPAYMYDAAHSSFNSGETRLSPDNASKLTLLWKYKLGDVLAAQPVVKGGVVYEGSWNGFLYALNAQDGALKWKVDLGRTTSPRCTPQSAGITSAAAATDDAVYIGGGDGYLYAFDPQSGAVKWKFRTGDNSEQGGVYNWASPTIYKGNVYYGIAAFCDNPFPRGEMWALDAATGKVNRQVYFVAPGQGGGGLWTSPVVDEKSGALFATTASADFYIPEAYSMVRLDPGNLSVVDSWQIPIAEQVFDGDWGTTPSLFTGAGGKLMVGASAKNGFFYAFSADNLRAGPVWSVQISDGGECPQCGEGAISSAAYAYDTLFVGAGYLSLGQYQKFGGSIHALDPSTGRIKWIHPTTGPVVPAVAIANGLVVVGAYDTVQVLDARSGKLLWEYATGAQIYAAPTVAGGVLYVASNDGYLYAFSAGPYPEQNQPYSVGQIGSNPPDFTPFYTPVPAPRLQGAEECFNETGHCARGAFLDYWRANGGMARYGPAVTDELAEAGRTVQYFRNAVLEIAADPDEKGARIAQARLDPHLFYYEPENEAFEPAEEKAGAVFVPETRHNLAEPFLSFWRANGEVAGLGYPVSEPFEQYDPVGGRTRRVQYFERARLQIAQAGQGQGDTQQVEVGALGLWMYRQRYGTLP